MGERERERNRDTDRETRTDRQTMTDKERESQRESQREILRHTEREGGGIIQLWHTDLTKNPPVGLCYTTSHSLLA